MTQGKAAGGGQPFVREANGDTTFYVYDMREPVLLSWMRDAASFGALAGCAYFLNVVIPPSGWLNAGLALAWWAWMVGRGMMRRHRMTPDEIRSWLDSSC